MTGQGSKGKGGGGKDGSFPLLFWFLPGWALSLPLGSNTNCSFV